MGGRHGPHAISAGDELLEFVVDELRGLRADMERHFAARRPEPPAEDDKHEEPDGPGPVAVPIKEPAQPPSKAQPVKSTEPATPKKAAAKRAPRKHT